MTTSSVPGGSSGSACQTIAGSRPETSRSARDMSRSRLMPGKTSTADFMKASSPDVARHAAALLHLRLFDQRAAALVERPECLVGGDMFRDLEIVPRLLRFRRRFYFGQIHVA